MSGRLILVVLAVVSLVAQSFATFDFTFRPPISQCPPGNSWTSWFDRDDPSGRCDCETLGDLRKENRGKICERPVGIEARDRHTKHLYTGNIQNIKISPTSGFACWNTRSHRCRDYEVRFCCPPRIQCRRPNDPRNGEVVSKNGNQDLFDPDQKVWFRCDRGFKLDGHKDFECQDDGSWEPQPFPTCVPERRQCRRPNDPRNGEVVSKNGNQDLFDPDQKVWFRCDRGFKLDGHKDFECQDDGSWKPQPFPRCVQDGPPISQCPPGNSWTSWFDRDDPSGRCDCETLGDLRKENRGKICERPVGIEARDRHTKHLYTGNIQNIKISPTSGFACWNTRSHRCRDYEVRFCCPPRIQCRRPNDPRNGEVVSKNGNQDLFDPDQKVWFRCDRGFKLDGHKDFECQDDGSWKPQPFPRCVPERRQCRRPNDPRNGEVVSKNGNQDLFDPDQKVWFRCDRGFKLDGHKDFECQDDGSWKPQPFPRCVQDGPPISQCPPGNSWTSWFDRDNPSGRCDCETLGDLRKENRGKICERPVGIEARDRHTKHLYTGNDQNIKISPTSGFACWNTKDHRCRDYEVRFCCPPRIQCRRPNDPRNGEVVSKNGNQDLFDPDQKVWFRCDRGFKLDGHKDFECQDDGSWKPQPFPRCVQDGPPISQCPPGNSWTSWFDRDDPSGRCDCETLGDLRKENRGKICERPVGIEARDRHTKHLYTGNDQNIKISPTSGFACWNTKDHRCRDYEVRFCCPPRIQCRRPNDPRNGEVVSKNGNQDLFDPDQKVWFRCDRGFKLDGHKDFECQDDGSWKPQPFPRCVPERRQCRRPNDPRNGEVVSKNGNQDLFDPDQKIWFRCDRGFKLDGHKDFECQDDGSWEPQPFPRCVPDRRQCRRPHDPRNGEVVSKNGNQDLFDPDQKVWFRCDRGFKLDGHKDFECQDDGSWEPQPFPRCVPDRRQCRRPNDPRNGEVVSKNGNQDLFDPDQKIWFRCDRGFKLDGHKDFECQDDGSWEPQPFPRCVPDRRQCRRPNDPRNGEVVSKNGNQDLFDPDQKVWFRCDRGFKHDGHKDFECQDDGSWEPFVPFPRCVPDGTGNPNQQTVVACERDFRTIVRCPQGYKIQVISGFYGRDDRQTCPHKSIHTDKCFAKGSLEKLQHQCNYRSSCRLLPSNNFYGDPCRGTHKYIKITYYCKKH